MEEKLRMKYLTPLEKRKNGRRERIFIIMDIISFIGFVVYLKSYDEYRYVDYWYCNSEAMYNFIMAEAILEGFAILIRVPRNLMLYRGTNPLLRTTDRNCSLFFCMTWFNAQIAILIWGNTFIYTDSVKNCKVWGGDIEQMYNSTLAPIIIGYLLFALYLYVTFVICTIFCTIRSVKSNGFYNTIKPGSIYSGSAAARNVAKAVAIASDPEHYKLCGVCHG